MFKLSVIEESLEHKQQVINDLSVFFFLQRIENVPDDTEPVWHINEYHIPDEKIEESLQSFTSEVKLTWYIHAFSDKRLYVVLRDKLFELSLHKDQTWNEMIQYGVEYAQVDANFLEDIPLDV